MLIKVNLDNKNFRGQTLKGIKQSMGSRNKSKIKNICA